MPPFSIHILFILLLGFSINAQASRFCFSVAKTYYEQLYCEIQASGAGKKLPAFNQFQNNNTLTQSLLLKPYARKLGITIKLPNKEKKAPSVASSHKSIANSGGLSHCDFKTGMIDCDNKQYRYLGNKSNDQLRDGALSTSNKMQLPVFNNKELDSYLAKTYEHYLNKMIEIGLAGVTLPYGNFEYIFHDLRAQNIDFNHRFETMYRYLKKDKQNMGVNKSIAPSGVTAKECFLLERLLVCSNGNYNYIYRP